MGRTRLRRPIHSAELGQIIVHDVAGSLYFRKPLHSSIDLSANPTQVYLERNTSLLNNMDVTLNRSDLFASNRGSSALVNSFDIPKKHDIDSGLQKARDHPTAPDFRFPGTQMSDRAAVPSQAKGRPLQRFR